jgi:uncharacterized tellurite resistance protein B-like protein
MKRYAKNSPEAVARVLAMTMVTDARLDDRELDIMERLGLYELLGLTRREFSEVLRTYCDDVVAAGSADGRVNLMDRTTVDAVLDAVDDPARRLQAATMVLNIVKADEDFHDAELALLRHILERWGLSLTDVRRAVSDA